MRVQKPSKFLWDRPSSWVRFELGAVTIEQQPVTLTLVSQHTMVDFAPLHPGMGCQHLAVEFYLHESETVDVLTPYGKHAHLTHAKVVPFNRVQEPA